MERESKSSVLTIGKVITGIVYAIILVYLVILTLAFFLRLFGANPAADFAEWVYNAAARIMEPFRGIFPTTQIGDTAVFDASLLFAIIVYSIVALALHSLIAWLSGRLTSLKYQADRDRYLAQAAAAQGVPPGTAAPTATHADAPTAAARPSPPRPG
jgi:uncharacterized protein YggT (Ycf19 family)